MSIIVPSSHTRMGAWVNNKNVGEKSTINSILYNIINCHARISHTKKNKKNTGSLGYNSVCYLTSRIGWVSNKGDFRYRCRIILGNCTEPFVTKDQPPPCNRPSGHKKHSGEIKVYNYITSSWYLNGYPEGITLGQQHNIREKVPRYTAYLH